MDPSRAFTEYESAAVSAIASATSETELEAARVEFLGKKRGRLKDLQRLLGEVPADQRRVVGQQFNEIKNKVETLLTMAAMKPAAQALRLTRVAWKNRRLFLSFPDKEADPFFYEHTFQSLLARLEALGRRWVLKDKDGRLRAIVQDVDSLADAAATLERLTEEAPVPA